MAIMTLQQTYEILFTHWLLCWMAGQTFPTHVRACSWWNWVWFCNHVTKNQFSLMCSVYYIPLHSCVCVCLIKLFSLHLHYRRSPSSGWPGKVQGKRPLQGLTCQQGCLFCQAQVNATIWVMDYTYSWGSVFVRHLILMCRIMKIFDFLFNYRVHLRLVVRSIIELSHNQMKC